MYPVRCFTYLGICSGYQEEDKFANWLKGILTAEDAIKAVDVGADEILVSSHGGRQLDGAMSTLDALPEIVEAVKGRIPVHIDGGIRRGSDIFKALALGADRYWVGRIPYGVLLTTVNKV